MNAWNQFLLGFNVSYALFGQVVSLRWIIALTFLFGVLLDENQRWGRKAGKPLHHHRTWIEEPLGLLLFGVPVAYLFGQIQQELFWVTLIVYGAHVVLDYLTMHEVSPLSPFSDRKVWVGFFKAVPEAPWYRGHEEGISENWFTLAMMLWLVVMLLW